MLATVGDYVSEARALLQDRLTPFRYATADLKGALGLGLYEARKLRPDLFAGGTVPDVDGGTADGTAVVMDRQFRMALVYYIVGHISMRDEEEGSDSRGAAFKRAFAVQLLMVAA